MDSAHHQQGDCKDHPRIGNAAAPKHTYDAQPQCEVTNPATTQLLFRSCPTQPHCQNSRILICTQRLIMSNSRTKADTQSNQRGLPRGSTALGRNDSAKISRIQPSDSQGTYEKTPQRYSEHNAQGSNTCTKYPHYTDFAESARCDHVRACSPI